MNIWPWTVDHLARGSMKSAAKCANPCELQNTWSIEILNVNGGPASRSGHIWLRVGWYWTIYTMRRDCYYEKSPALKAFWVREKLSPAPYTQKLFQHSFKKCRSTIWEPRRAFCARDSLNWNRAMVVKEACACASFISPGHFYILFAGLKNQQACRIYIARGKEIASLRCEWLYIGRKAVTWGSRCLNCVCVHPSLFFFAALVCV